MMQVYFNTKLSYINMKLMDCFVQKVEFIASEVSSKVECILAILMTNN